MGVYVHIPFCRQKCYYCGFYSVASQNLKQQFIDSVCREIELRNGYLPEGPEDSLYFGGGTPSFLDLEEIELIVRKIEGSHTFTDNAERTIELNPEDADREKLRGLKTLGFNRLSIGVQSFQDRLLAGINRKHNGCEAETAVLEAAAAGFDNIGIDLIIGLPGSEIDDLKKDLEIVRRLPLSHVSVYILSIDPGSVLEKLAEKGKFLPDGEDQLAEKYLRVSDCLKDFGFEHYEISNFARNGRYSVHNTAYWQQKPYIGYGPSAHSYDGLSRQWNIANLRSYIDGCHDNTLHFEKENLNECDLYNEFIMTNLRTMWGIEIHELERKFGEYWKQSGMKLDTYVANDYVRVAGDSIRLTEKGWLISDRIFSDLFV